MTPTLIAIGMAPVALIPLALVVQYLVDDAAETADLRRLTVPLPEPRMNLAFPSPVTPMDLPARWDTQATAALAAPSRLRALGRHRVGEAPGTDTQRQRWNSPTGQFWLIVDALGDLEEPCSHCSAPEDKERPHVGCPGCCCPCTPPLPEGVEGYAIAGGTR